MANPPSSLPYTIRDEKLSKRNQITRMFQIDPYHVHLFGYYNRWWLRLDYTIVFRRVIPPSNDVDFFVRLWCLTTLRGITSYGGFSRQSFARFFIIYLGIWFSPYFFGVFFYFFIRFSFLSLFQMVKTRVVFYCREFMRYMLVHLILVERFFSSSFFDFSSFISWRRVWNFIFDIEFAFGRRLFSFFLKNYQRTMEIVIDVCRTTIKRITNKYCAR